METGGFDYREARRYCMSYGMKVAVWWCASFLCNMLGMRYPLLGNLGLVAGIFSIWYAGRLLRGFNRQSGQRSMLRTWWMAMLTYVFATLCTTLVQYLYFRFWDGGAFLEQMRQALEMPAYRQLFNGISDEELREAFAVFGDAPRLTYRMFLLNIALGLVLSLPTMLIGVSGLNKKKG